MLVNATPFPAQDVPYVDKDGQEVVIGIVKATFEVLRTGKIVRAAEPSSVRLVDEPYDPKAEQSSVLFPSDVADRKQGTDVVVVGDFISAGPTTMLDAGLTVGPASFPIRVHGPRLFHKGLTGMAVGPAARFERLSMKYEFAYGGTSPDYSEVEPRNPVGRGVAKKTADLDGTLAPQLEHPARPYRSAADKHEPWCFAPIPSHWSPRKDYFGTVDEVWKETRMPLMPADFDERYNNFAPSFLQFARGIPAGASIAVLGMNAEGLVKFDLPEFRTKFIGVYENGKYELDGYVDTILIEPNRRRIELVSRGCFPLGRTNLLRELRIDLKR
jgi:hypothetical protein